MTNPNSEFKIFGLFIILISALTASLIFISAPKNYDPYPYIETDQNQIQLVKLFNNQTLGLRFVDQNAIFYLESKRILPPDYQRLPSYYLIGWWPHPARVMKIDLNTYLAHSIYDSHVGPTQTDPSVLDSDTQLINFRNISQTDITYLDQFQTFSQFESESLMFQIFQPNYYYSTINFIGYDSDRWASELFEANSIMPESRFFINLLEPIVDLLAMIIDAILHYFPIIVKNLPGLLYALLALIYAHILFVLGYAGFGIYLLTKNFHSIFNWNLTYYVAGFFILFLLYYCFLSVCCD